MADAQVLTLQETLQKAAAYLEQRGIESARRESEWIFAETLGLSRMELYTRFDMPLTAAQAASLRQLIQRRGRREPLAYVLGNQEFCGLQLTVNADVLVPRPETEELVEQVLKTHPQQKQRVADIGTGSGAIALALKHKRPGWELHATDTSAAALAVAAANAADLQLDISFSRGDLQQALDGRFDVVVANLPYIGENEREFCDQELSFEPQQALFAAADGLALIERLVNAVRAYLQPGGSLWLECGFRQAAAIAKLAGEQELRPQIFRDLQGHERMLRLELPNG